MNYSMGQLQTSRVVLIKYYNTVPIKISWFLDLSRIYGFKQLIYIYVSNSK